MSHRTPHALVVLGLAAGLAACGDSQAPWPTAPTAAPVTPIAAAPVPESTIVGGQFINGVVSDTALRRLAGARVEFLDGPQAGVSATTDAMGHFQLFGVIDDTTRFRASKDGYLAADATVLPRCDGCNPRWVIFYLNVPEAPVALAGDYTLTFIADASCTNLPSELRMRRYEATIAPGDFTWVGFPAHSRTSFKVTPQGSVFPDGLNYFWLNVAGHDVAIVLGDHTDPGVTERVDDSTYFAFMGSAMVSVAAPVSTIATAFDGWIDRCIDPSMPQRYDCMLGQSRLTRCESHSHQLILERH